MNTGSKLVLVIEALFVIVGGWFSASLTTNVNVALLPLTSRGIEAVITPLLPVGGVLIPHPGGADKDTKVK